MGSRYKRQRAPWLLSKLELCYGLLDEISNKVSCCHQHAEAVPAATPEGPAVPILQYADCPKCSFVQGLCAYPDQSKTQSLLTCVAALQSSIKFAQASIIELGRFLGDKNNRKSYDQYCMRIDSTLMLVKTIREFTEHVWCTISPTHPLWLDYLIDRQVKLLSGNGGQTSIHMTAAPLQPGDAVHLEYEHLDYFTTLKNAVQSIKSQLQAVERTSKEPAISFSPELWQSYHDVNRQLERCEIFVDRVSWLSPCLAHLGALSAHELGHYCLERIELEPTEEERQSLKFEPGTKVTCSQLIEDQVKRACSNVTEADNQRFDKLLHKMVRVQLGEEIPETYRVHASKVILRMLRSYLKELFADAFAVHSFGSVSYVAFYEKVLELDEELDDNISLEELLEAYSLDSAQLLTPTDEKRSERIEASLRFGKYHPPSLVRAVLMSSILDSPESEAEIYSYGDLFISICKADTEVLRTRIRDLLSRSHYEETLNLPENSETSSQWLFFFDVLIDSADYVRDLVQRVFDVGSPTYPQVELKKTEVDQLSDLVRSGKTPELQQKLKELLSANDHPYAFLLAASHRIYMEYATTDWAEYLACRETIIEAAHRLRHVNPQWTEVQV